LAIKTRNFYIERGKANEKIYEEHLKSNPDEVCTICLDQFC
jgi:hypothetical protein